MLGIILGLLYQINGSLMTITQRSVSSLCTPRQALSFHLLFVPIGIIFILLAYLYDSSRLSDNLYYYFSLIFVFGFVVALNIYLGFSVLKNINTSSFFKYKVGITMSLALISDYLFFHIMPTYLSIFVGLLFIISGNLLNNVKQKELKLKLFLKLLVLSIGIVASTSILKEIVMISTNNFLSIFVTQTITQAIVGMFGFNFFTKLLKDKNLLKYAFLYNIVILFGIIIEYFAFKLLSVFAIIALSNIKFIIYLGFDLFKKDLEINKKMIIGTVIGFTAIILLSYTKLG